MRINLSSLSMLSGARRRSSQLPLHVEKPSLDSLYTSRSAIKSGLAGQVGVCLLSYHATWDPFYLWYIAFAVLVLVCRDLHMRAYDRAVPFLRSEAAVEKDLQWWRVTYIVGSSASSLVVGAMTGYSLVVHPQSWASVLTLALVMGSMIATVGRNFGYGVNVAAIIVVAFSPVMGGFALYGWNSGDLVNGIGSALLIIPFLLATNGMASDVRKRLHETENSRKDAIDQKNTAQEHKALFFSAVSNMPNGLMIVNGDGVVTFANGNVKEMLGVPEDMELSERTTVEHFFAGGVLKKHHTRRQAHEFIGMLNKLIRGEEDKAVITLRKGLVVEFAVRKRMSENGTVLPEPDGYVIVCTNVTDRERNLKQIEEAALTDALSGMPNRSHMRLFASEAHHRMRSEQRALLCVFDVDKFKHINDNYGHLVGDGVIKKVADSMKGLARDYPSLAISRFGGDEFMMMMVFDPGFDVKGFLDEAFARICRTYVILGKRVDVRCSGGAIICTRQEINPATRPDASLAGRINSIGLDMSVQKADHALYKVKQDKRERRNPDLRWAMFDEELEKQYRNTEQMRTELETAVARKQMIVYYQPMCTTDGKSIKTCEALCRWEHPQLGILSPDVFIGLAESMNMIGDITREMIKTACRDCATWDNETGVSVNLSVLDLTQDEIVTTIRDTLAETGLSPTRLQVEITETVLLKDADKARRILLALKEMGVRTAMDDFGTGYANLSMINDLPLDKVKIDRSFIRKISVEEKSRKLFDAVVALARNMGLEIVVEGVETKDQLDYITKNGGVNLIQGYLFGRPMPNRDFKALLDAKRPSYTDNVIQLASAGRGSSN